MVDSENKDKVQPENSSFKVEDKRLFNADGSPIFDPDNSTKKETESRETSRREETRTDEREASSRQSEKPAGIDFASFTLSLATSAMAHLGEVPDPASGKVTENLEAAQQMIDILTMLDEKTKGNLEPEEADLLENLLYELRMKYLSKTQVISL